MYIIYLYTFFLLLIFFIYGLVLSNIIDYIFPDATNINDEIYTFIEIIGEIGIAYLIYNSLKYYQDKLLNVLFYNISKNRPPYLNTLLLFAFSIGIFKHLQKSKHKMLYFRRKYCNPIMKKLPYCQYFVIK